MLTAEDSIQNKLDESVSHPVVSDSLQPPWTVARQDPLSMEFSKQEYWSGLPFLSPGGLPNQVSNLGLLLCRQIFYCLSHQGSPEMKLILKYRRNALSTYFCTRYSGFKTGSQTDTIFSAHGASL